MAILPWKCVKDSVADHSVIPDTGRRRKQVVEVGGVAALAVGRSALTRKDPPLIYFGETARRVTHEHASWQVGQQPGRPHPGPLREGPRPEGRHGPRGVARRGRAPAPPPARPLHPGGVARPDYP